MVGIRKTGLALKRCRLGIGALILIAIKTATLDFPIAASNLCSGYLRCACGQNLRAMPGQFITIGRVFDGLNINYRRK